MSANPALKPANVLNQFSWRGILCIFRKELIQLFRDKYLVGFIIALPLIQLLVTGLAIQRDLNHIPTIVCNYDHRSASQELLTAFGNSTLFDITTYAGSDAEVVRAIRSGKYRVGIVIPPDYSDKIMTSGSEKAEVNIVVDGTNANISKTILDSAQVIVAQYAVRLNDSQLMQGTASDLTPVSLESKVLYNPNLRSSYFLIPAILGILMHMLTILFTSFTIVRERETGTLEQLMVTPVKVADLMLGKVIPYMVIGFSDMILTLAVMVWFFHIPITGSFWFLCLASIIFILTSLAIGLLISCTCQNQVQAIQITVGIFLPSILLTGFVFPIDPMPWFIKIISYSLPLTYYLQIIRGVVIKGIGFPELWLPTLILALLSVLMVGLSIFRFKKQVA